MKNNPALVAFLNGFGADYDCAEDIFSWDWGNDNDNLIHHEAYYGVFGNIEKEFDFEKYGVKITFQKNAMVPYDRTGDYFWIRIDGDFSYILDEERDLSVPFSQKSERFGKIKALFKKK